MATTDENAVTKLPVRVKVGYGMGNMATGLMINSLGLYLLVFFTDIVGISGALAGIAMAVGRFWDAVSDPAMGHISDRTRCHFGRRRPYMLAGGAALAAVFVLLWCTPSTWSTQATFVFLTATYLLYTTMMTVVTVPYGALGAELTMDYQERNSVMAYQQGAFLVGFGLGACLLNLASLIGAWLDPATTIGSLTEAVRTFFASSTYKMMDGAGFRYAALVFAPIIMGAYLTTVFTTRENPAFQRASEAPAWRSLYSTFKNRPFRIFMIAFLICTTAGQVGSFMLPYILIHWLHKPGYVLPGYLLHSLAIFASLPLWQALGKRMEKKHCFCLAMGLGTVVMFLFLVVVRAEWPPSILIWAMVLGLTYGGLVLFPPSMLADIVDTDELDTGLRREGAFMGVHHFLLKCATSLGALWVGPGLTLVGYDGQAAAQSETTLFLMRLMVVLPTLFNIGVILLMMRYPLTSAVMADVRRTIDARSSEHPSLSPTEECT